MIFSIGLCGALGASLRFFCSQTLIKQQLNAFPKATFFINLLGSFLLGICFSLHNEHILSDQAWNLIGVGFLGAFTTFSTFSYECYMLLRNNKWKLLSLYIAGSVILGVVFAALGIILTSILLSFLA